jgi:hypothetical protein
MPPQNYTVRVGKCSDTIRAVAASSIAISAKRLTPEATMRREHLVWVMVYAVFGTMACVWLLLWGAPEVVHDWSRFLE